MLFIIPISLLQTFCNRDNILNISISMPHLGWQTFFQQQLTLEELESNQCARIIAHHRSVYVLQLENKQVQLPITVSMPVMTVGDWLLLTEEYQFIRLLERKSVLKRKSAGSKVDEQFIAANIDVLFIVSSLNQDFNLNRIERYLAIANEASIEPVIVLTKSDLTDNWQALKQQVQSLDPFLSVEVVNSLDINSVDALKPWCKQGSSVSFIGSSGVGKSTLVNTLLGKIAQVTSHIREDDDKGRHTTTARSVHFMSSGGVLIDTPGMRELQLVDCNEGVDKTFADISQLAEQCRFSNCQHSNEPGCAILQALEVGDIDQRRLNNYFKLQAEQARNSATMQVKRAKDKALSKMYRNVQTSARLSKKGY